MANLSIKKIVSKKTFIIAEIGINHNGSFLKCKKMINLAAKSGANAVKIQTINPEESYHKSSPSYNAFHKKDFSLDQLKKLKQFAEKKKIIFFSTPGDRSSLEKLIKLKVKIIKISSGLLTNIPLIEMASNTKAAIILSTGMAIKEDIDRAIKILKKNNSSEYYLLKCTSLYPANDILLNLRGINEMEKQYKISCGYSDHTTDELASITAAALGAKIIEKHFKLSKNDNCPDKNISLCPKDFNKMCKKIRRIEKMLGDKKIGCTKEELKIRSKSHRYIFPKQNMKVGETITFDKLVFKRSMVNGEKLEPRFYSTILNKKIKKKISVDKPITFDHL